MRKCPQDHRLTIAQLIKCTNRMCSALDVVLQTMCVCKYLTIRGRNIYSSLRTRGMNLRHNTCNRIFVSSFNFFFDIVLWPREMRIEIYSAKISLRNRDTAIVINVELLKWHRTNDDGDGGCCCCS